MQSVRCFSWKMKNEMIILLPLKVGDFLILHQKLSFLTIDLLLECRQIVSWNFFLYVDLFFRTLLRNRDLSCLAQIFVFQSPPLDSLGGENKKQRFCCKNASQKVYTTCSLTFSLQLHPSLRRRKKSLACVSH